MCVLVYMYMCVLVYMCVYVFVCTYEHVYVCMCAHLCTCVCLLVCTNVSVCHVASSVISLTVTPVGLSSQELEHRDGVHHSLQDYLKGMPSVKDQVSCMEPKDRASSYVGHISHSSQNVQLPLQKCYLETTTVCYVLFYQQVLIQVIKTWCCISTFFLEILQVTFLLNFFW